MGLNRTEFIKGLYVSYPLGSLPKLFATLGASSKKAFFERMTALDSPGADGLPLDKYIEFIWIGLQTESPDMTLAEATCLISEFYDEFGLDGLENFVIDAFADARLSDKDAIEKRRQLILELKALEFQKMELNLKSRYMEVSEAEKQLDQKVADLGEASPSPKVILHNQRQKKKTHT